MPTYRSSAAFALVISTTSLLLGACGGPSDDSPGTGGSSTTGTGGSTAAKGGASSGGATNSAGGAASTGGSTSAAGGSSTGGTTSASGGSSAGGTASTAGGSSSGGTASTAGGSSSGGTASTAGGSSSGGTASTAGGSSSGGTASTAGGSSTGGTTSTGTGGTTSTGTGGTTSTGTGGTTSAGGKASGGATSTGGTTGTGGTTSTGGTGSGGTATTGGTTSTGGTGGTDNAIRVPQMTACTGVTSGLSASVIYYVTPTGTGNGSSFASGMSLTAALAAVKAGEMVLLQPGTYTIPVVSSTKRNTIVLSKSGTSGAPIYLVAANCGRAKFDFSYPADQWQSGDGKSFGFMLSGNYWYLKNIDVTNAGYHGIWIGGTTADPTGGTYNTIENCSFYNNRNSGLENQQWWCLQQGHQHRLVQQLRLQVARRRHHGWHGRRLCVEAGAEGGQSILRLPRVGQFGRRLRHLCQHRPRQHRVQLGLQERHRHLGSGVLGQARRHLQGQRQWLQARW
ncbi:MAG: hypothetical protein QM756_34415 [Polyangiaceae bacterium]